MKTYEAIFNEDQTTGVYGISLVKKPAMEGTFIALSKQEPILFKEVDKEQRKVVGLVLEPNKLIPRFNKESKEEYNIVFSEDTIKNLSYNFFKQNFHKNSSLEHNSKIEGVTFVESWIVEDVKLDKQNLYGFEYPVGSWVAVLKIDNEDIWNNYVKTGAVQGFSIDGLLELKEINLNKKDIKMSEILTEIKDLIKASFSKKEEVKLGAIKTVDGSVTIEFDGDILEVGKPAWIMAEDGTKVPVPIGEHPLEDGTILVVTEEGIVGEIKTPQAEEEAPAPENLTEKANQDTQIAKEIESAIKSILIKYSEIESKVNEVIKQNEELKLALSEQPATKKINVVPTQFNQNLSLAERINNKLNN
jgi:hypothetical protein